MDCKHLYFQFVEGVLRCTQCDKTAEEAKGIRIEDKVGERTEAKRIVPHGVRKVGRPKRR